MKEWSEWETQLNQRFRNFIEFGQHRIEEASLINFPDESSMAFEAHSPSQVGVPFNFLNQFEAWSFSIEVLRRLPRYLCGMTLLTDGNRVNQGHYEYWRYTGAFAGLAGGFRSPVSLQGQFEQIPEETAIDPNQLPDWLTLPTTRLELNDLCLLLHLGLLGVQKTKIRLQQMDTENIHTSGRAHPSLEKTVEHSFNLTTRYGFPVLEGFAGKWRQESSSSLQNKLEDWARNTENVITKTTLGEINYLPRLDVDGDIVEQLYTIGEKSLSNPSETFGKDSTFYQLNDARWKTQHGEESYSGPAVVVTTLSCLAFWDMISKVQYNQLRRRIQHRVNEDHNRQERFIRNMEWTPEDFYNPVTIRRL